MSIFEDMTNAEREVAGFLSDLRIWWTFQQPVCVEDEKSRPRIWSPDFYLSELGLYIEVCGSERFDYSYREKIYKANRIPVIFVHLYKEGAKWSYFLIQRIKEIHAMRSGIIDKLV
ncbi:MAG: hypothetical protein WED04_08035 [Promethearchaeati archaeon SRVP18_Atabeyarchaeia-1]